MRRSVLEGLKKIIANKLYVTGIIALFMLGISLGIIRYTQGASEPQPTNEASVDETYFISDTPITYTAFIPVNNEDQSFEDNVVWQRLQEMTNVYFEFISPIGGETSEELLKKLFASGDYPDLVLNSTAGYAGGFDKAISDGIYIDIAPYMDTYAPNYSHLLSTYSEQYTDVYTESGKMAGFWEVYDPVDYMPIVGGMTVRRDMLDATGMSVPETIDEWTEFLRALKQIDSVEYPMIFGQQNGVNVTAEFLSAYGIGSAPISTMNSYEQLFYPVDGEIKYGAVEEGYSDYLMQMHAWYAEGLIDRNFGIRSFTDLFERSQLIADGKAAVNWQYAEWMPLYQDADGNLLDLVPIPMPKLEKSDPDVMWMVSRKPYTGRLLSITTACEEVEPLIQFFDFLYSEEGIRLMNYGIEGDTYELEGDEPMYTSKVTDYTKGSFEGVGKYVNNHSAVMYDLSYTEDVQRQMYGDQAVVMKQTWLDSTDFFTMDMELTVEENSRLIRIMSSITNYVTEYTIKAIVTGKDAINWHEHIENIESMGIDEAIDIMQTAYDRKGGMTDENPSE